MNAVLKKELRSFLTSIAGYGTLSIFIICNGLVLWFFKNPWNILDSGLADVSNFFSLAPWIFIVLVPALTMRSFSQELQWGTLEILQTKQVSVNALILSKFFANLIIFCLMLLFTFSFVWSIYVLNAGTKTSIDFGSIFTSYLGLIFIGSCQIAVGLFCSTFSKNQLIVLLFSVGICFLLFYGIFAMAESFGNYDYHLEKWSMYWHYQGIERGVLDTKDVLYFLQLTFIFLFFTRVRMKKRYNLKNILYVFVFMYGVHFVGQHFNKRLDCTKDGRYTLSSSSIRLLKSIEKPTMIKVYLEGNFPAQFRRLQLETKYLLQEMENINPNIKFVFVNPSRNLEKHIAQGRTPSRIVQQENGVVTETLLVPWASVHSNKKSSNIALLKEHAHSKNQQEQIKKSIENLEYAFINGLKKIYHKKSKKIAVLVGNGELGDNYLFDLLHSLKPHYHLAKFTLDSVATAPLNTLRHLQKFDLAILAKPTESFSEKEKFVLDQFALNGGRSLWLIDPAQAARDSLFSTGKMLAYPVDLNVDDLFFAYGVRLEKNLIKDLSCSKITLSAGNIGRRTNFKSFLWQYHPLVKPEKDHRITKNVDRVNLQFASSITLLKNTPKKTILLQSSGASKKIGLPSFVKLSEVATPVIHQTYKSGKQNLCVLLEGDFNSAYKDRVQPFDLKNALKHGQSKMVIVSDGDIASNQIHNKKPLPLGFDKWTQEFYANKEFLQNTIDYLLDNANLIKIRSKTMAFPLFNKEKLMEERIFWKWFNLLMPLGLLTFLFGGSVFFYKRKFSRL